MLVGLGIFVGKGFNPAWLRPILGSLGVSLGMSIIAFALSIIIGPYVDRTNDNDGGTIASFAFRAGVLLANIVSVIGSFFFGMVTGLFVIVGAILFITTLYYLSILHS